MNRVDLRKAIRKARLYVLLTQELCKKPLLEVARLTIEGGADVLQLREKGMPEGFLHLALELRTITRKSNILFIVNDSPSIALKAQVDGLHLGQEDLPIKEARCILGKDRLIGVSVHNIEQARKAQEEGADYLGVGPIFPTKTKAKARAVGLELLRQVSQEMQIPYFAIGGINTTNLKEVILAGTKQVAVSSAIISQEDILSATRRLSIKLHTGDASASRSESTCDDRLLT